jgi:hypothetical protein
MLIQSKKCLTIDYHCFGLAWKFAAIFVEVMVRISKQVRKGYGGFLTLMTRTQRAMPAPATLISRRIGWSSRKAPASQPQVPNRLGKSSERHGIRASLAISAETDAGEGRILVPRRSVPPG